MGSEILTINEVAEYLHLHRTTIYGLLKRRELAGFWLAGAGHWRFTRDEIDRWRTDAERKTAPASRFKREALQ
ncbi:MAG: helix-turn-helix domain-containing protein [Deltaproteobacteria bacterium]|nr:helix-turn-helix domain-containing protein [Deltaproteobacteria bacterium]